MTMASEYDLLFAALIASYISKSFHSVKSGHGHEP